MLGNRLSKSYVNDFDDLSCLRQILFYIRFSSWVAFFIPFAKPTVSRPTQLIQRKIEKGLHDVLVPDLCAYSYYDGKIILFLSFGQASNKRSVKLQTKRIILTILPSIICRGIIINSRSCSCSRMIQRSESRLIFQTPSQTSLLDIFRSFVLNFNKAWLITFLLNSIVEDKCSFGKRQPVICCIFSGYE